MRIEIAPGITGPELVARIAALAPLWQIRLFRQFKAVELRAVAECWPLWAQDGQLPPEDGDEDNDAWRIWLIRAGRGFGKTRAGAEWVSEIARAVPGARIALVGGTADDVRAVMIEGESGILAVARDDEFVRFHRTAGEVEFQSGARAYVFSAEAPESLRGPQHHAAWCDEIAKWRYGEAAWDNLMFGLRLGDRPRVLVTTTPAPAAILRKVMTSKGVVEYVGRSRDNKYLAESLLAAWEAEYGGTRLGRQELEGELIDDVPNALWSRATIEACRVAEAPDLVRVVVAVDPPAGMEGDACGIVACGVDEDGVAYVIEDASVAGASPEGWARAVAACAARVEADKVVAEKNQGGEMVRHVLEGAEDAPLVTLVHASKGKTVRAEPIVRRYERGKVKHVGAFCDLEDQLCGMMVGGRYEGPGRSPDRADALVWALTELLLGKKKKASVRRL